MIRNHKNVCRVWIILSNCLFYFLQLLWVSVSAFSSLVGIPIGIASSAMGLKKVLVLTAGIKKYKSIIKKNKKKHESLN